MMHINDKTVTFESTSVSLVIPYKEIDAVEIQAKLFDQFLLLKTKNGVLSFSGFLSVKKAQESVSECIIK